CLNETADAYWHFIHDTFDSNGLPLQDPTIYLPIREKADAAMDEYMRLTGISHIVLDATAVSAIANLSSGFASVHKDLEDGRISRDAMSKLKHLIDATYDRIIEIARSGLQAKSRET
ncbi:MAG: hypothetical protein AB7I59_22265, partial [Geminicoccaceae bacterium]